MKPCTSPRFVYKPLDSSIQTIRVITLNAGSFSDPICININEVILGVCLVYPIRLPFYLFRLLIKLFTVAAWIAPI